jgi:hypothetical protein
MNRRPPLSHLAAGWRTAHRGPLRGWAALDAGALSLAGVVGGGRDLCLSLGYRGRHDGGLHHGPNDPELLERPGALQWIGGGMLPGDEP